MYDSELKNDDNQFGFQSESSTAMCSWTVIEVINWFTKRGASIYACLLDYRKAFDMVNHVKMFTNLINRSVALVIIRLMIVMYLAQRCYIRWESAQSYSFAVTNGVRQGSIFSPKGGFATYLDPLISSLRESGYGCIVAGFWYGALFYADDGILLSTSVTGLQKMVTICEEHAKSNNLEFSTDLDPKKSKTICMAFHGGKAPAEVSKIMLNGREVPWRERSLHIGNTLHIDAKMNQDLKEKRAKFIDRSIELNQKFALYPPDVKLAMAKLYNSHFTGSSLWDFGSDWFSKLAKSYNVNLRIIYDLPWDTHCWVVEELSGGKHLKQMVYSRYVTLVENLAFNKRPMIRSLFDKVSHSNDSVTWSNLRTILLDTDVRIEPGVTNDFALANYRVYGGPPEGMEWLIPMLVNLMEVRDGRRQVSFDSEIGDLHKSEIDSIMKDLCSN